jgi:hypothetical protein
MIVLAAYFIQPILEARQRGAPAAEISIDLGLTRLTAPLTSAGAHLPAGETLTWAMLDEIADASQNCFRLEAGALEKIQAFSEYTNRHYVLMATESAPTMLISGIPMHRIKDTNPHADTLAKLRAVKPVFGQVLDTATGLGYTAIEAARSASHVVTIELDPTVLEIIRQNPWSQDLLDNPRITQLIGDSFDRIEEFADGSFDRIIHDPPTISLAGELYSTDFYRQLYRVLRGNGILFHYIGNLDSKLGKNVSRGVAKRLQAAGFRRIHDRKDAYGLAARK